MHVLAIKISDHTDLRRPPGPGKGPFAGDRPRMADNEVPVFWACGVTPQVVVEQARPPLCITHKPGCMLVTDLLNARMAIS